MFTTLPKDYHKFQIWSWAEFQPYGDDLTKRKLTASNLTTWLSDWSDLSRVIQEMNQRLYVGITVSTTDQEMKQRYNAFLDDIYPQFQVVNQQCKEKLLATGIEPDGMRVPLMHMRAEAAVYREANLPFLVANMMRSLQPRRSPGKVKNIPWLSFNHFTNISSAPCESKSGDWESNVNSWTWIG
jgi:oligoendopeptidase F